MDKKKWNIYNGILVIQRNKVGSIVQISMDLETVIQSEVCHKNKILYIDTYTWNLEKWYR